MPLNSWNFPEHQTSWENINKDMNDIFYNITSASLSWNPHILLTYNSHYYSIRHSNRITYSMFDILFMYNTSLNQTRKEISTFLMSLHQLPEGCSSTLFSPAEWPSGFIIGQRASDPFPETSAGSSTPLGVTRNHWAEDLLHPRHTFHWPHGKFSPCCLYPPRVLTNGTLLNCIF